MSRVLVVDYEFKRKCENYKGLLEKEPNVFVESMKICLPLCNGKIKKENVKKNQNKQTTRKKGYVYRQFKGMFKVRTFNFPQPTHSPHIHMYCMNYTFRIKCYIALRHFIAWLNFFSPFNRGIFNVLRNTKIICEYTKCFVVYNIKKNWVATT